MARRLGANKHSRRLQTREKWAYPGSTTIILHVLIEFFTDSTNSPGDYYQFCIDNNANGGAAPQTDDIRIDWVGHSQSGLKVYREQEQAGKNSPATLGEPT